MLEATVVGAAEAETVFDFVTHIIVYRKEGQTISEKEILGSLGDQGVQDMVMFGRFILPNSEQIRVVYVDWLSDSLESNKIMPVEAYLAIPEK
ncbi:hypothetical protein KC19_VG183200 [Ceratodon purpureus]|uniref:BRCT domain-containing protein n=1 Tax=Ceratodon purpureus TaxID=3225 RepID=A0A8T0HRT0_CERPU|nr:hypothetical protein KC19_VG183200 [Ceratodon purpureus]